MFLLYPKTGEPIELADVTAKHRKATTVYCYTNADMQTETNSSAGSGSFTAQAPVGTVLVAYTSDAVSFGDIPATTTGLTLIGQSTCVRVYEVTG